MNQVLGIVSDHNLVAHLVADLVHLHTAVDPVEAVAFRSGPIVRTHGEMDAWIAGGGIPHGGHSGFVVGIDAYEDGEIPVADRVEVSLEHLSNDAMLFPQGDEDG